MEKIKNIWHFPTWYPNAKNRALGTFVKKQIVLASEFSRQIVIYLVEDSSTKTNFSIEKKQLKNVIEFFVSFIPSSSRISNLNRKNKAYNFAVDRVIAEGFYPDFIHAHSISFTSFYAQKVAKKYLVKWALSEHWSGFLKDSGAFNDMPFLKRKMWINHSKKADAILCVSRFLEDSMKWCGLKNDSYVIIPNVVQGGLKESMENNDFIYLNVSDLVDSVKNISGLVKAFDNCWKEDNTIKLWLVGAGKDEDKIRELIGILPSKEAVRFFGRLDPDEVLALYPQVSTTVINSNFETFSVVAAESLIAGKPIISTKCGGPEEFADENQAIFIDTNNQKQLELAMKTMKENYNNYNPIELHQAMKDQFSDKLIIEKLKRLYEA